MKTKYNTLRATLNTWKYRDSVFGTEVARGD